jgi:cytochrome b561
MTNLDSSEPRPTKLKYPQVTLCVAFDVNFSRDQASTMTIEGKPKRYSSVAQVFHWLTVVFVLAAYIVSEGGSESRIYSAAGDNIRRIHETFGLVVFCLLVLRILWRLTDPSPALPPGPAWMEWSAKLVHVLLYLLLGAIPLTAIFGTWFEGHPLTPLGFDIGPQVELVHELGRRIIEIHTTLGNVIIWMAGLHAAAALAHHFILRDGVLKSMLPGRK